MENNYTENIIPQSEQNNGNQLENERPQNSTLINKISNYIKIPKITYEKMIRLIIIILGSIFMIINFYYGQATAHYHPYCLDDMSHNYTEFINDFFFEHNRINFSIKFIFSTLVDLSIIYTLIIWCFYSKNIRLITTLLSYTLLNLIVRYIHKTIQPDNAAFIKSYFPSIFVNYQKTTYSFFSLVIGLGHYMFIINEFFLQKLFGDNYLGNITLNKKFIKLNPDISNETLNLNTSNRNSETQKENEKDALQLKAEEEKKKLLELNN